MSDIITLINALMVLCKDNGVVQVVLEKLENLAHEENEERFRLADQRQDLEAENEGLQEKMKGLCNELSHVRERRDEAELAVHKLHEEIGKLKDELECLKSGEEEPGWALNIHNTDKLWRTGPDGRDYYAKIKLVKILRSGPVDKGLKWAKEKVEMLFDDLRRHEDAGRMLLLQDLTLSQAEKLLQVAQDLNLDASIHLLPHVDF